MTRSNPSGFVPSYAFIVELTVFRADPPYLLKAGLDRNHTDIASHEGPSSR